MIAVKVGTIVQMKKQHPCGTNKWKVVRYGADVKIECVQCNRVVLLERPKFLKNIKRVLDEGGSNERSNE